MEVGKYIKSLRERKEISQAELGKIVGVQRAAVQKWESGLTQNLKRETILKLADYFNVAPSSFICVAESEKSTTDDVLSGNTIIFNRNGEIVKKKFSEEQMKYLEKFISSLADEDYPDL